MKIIGYVNPNGYYPSPLIAIAESNKEHFAFYPGGGPFVIDDFDAVMQELTDIVLCQQNQTINTNQYVYAINPNRLFIDTPGKMFNKLSRILKSDNLSDIERQVLTEYLSENKADDTVISLNEYTWGAFLEYLKKLHKIRVLITRRVTKKSKQESKRIIIQLEKRANYKTFYRKNVPIGADYTERNVNKFLVSAFAANKFVTC